MSKHDEELEDRICVDCHAVAPKTQTDYTLISAKHAWRLARVTDAFGRTILDWRCPTCWEKHKAARPAGKSTSEPPSSRVPISSRPSKPGPTR